jgi:cytochrome P450 family 4
LTPTFRFQILESSGGSGLDVYPHLTRAALDIICETSMDKRREGANNEISDYLKSANRITQVVMERGVRPWLKSDWTFRWLSLGRENQKCVDILHHFIKSFQPDSPSE